jgi:hypothetical protein
VSTRSNRSEPDSDFDALFSAPADRFIAVRDELAARAQAAGRRDLAIRLKSMKRPPTVVWLANALAREAPKIVQSLLDASVKLRKAYSSNDQKGIRDATQQRHQALSDALRHGRRILTNAGHGLATERRLTKTLIGASMDDAQATLLAEGRLVREIEPPRLGGELVNSYPAPTKKRPAEHDRPAEREAKRRQREFAKELRSAEQTAEKAKRVAQQAAKIASRHAESAAAAQQAAESAKARARELRSVADQRLTDAEALRRRAGSGAEDRSKLH